MANIGELGTLVIIVFGVATLWTVGHYVWTDIRTRFDEVHYGK